MKLRNRTWLAGLRRCLVLFLLTVTAGCTGDVTADGPVAKEDIASVRLIGSGIALPASASDVWLYEVHDRVDLQMIRFDAPIGEARAFAAELLGEKLVPGHDAGLRYLGPDRAWWLDTFPTGSEGGEKYFQGPAKQIQLLPMGSRARVWVVIFTE